MMPGINRVILYLLLTAITGPSFGSYTYFFQMDVIQFSKQEYANLNVCGYVAMTLATIFYNQYLKEKEFRTCIWWATFFQILGAASSLIFILRLNIAMGISDGVFIVATSIVIDLMTLAFI